MKFDPTKPVQTRDGRPARIICMDANGKYPIIALVQNSLVYRVDNKGTNSLGFELINIPEKKVFYVNIYPSGQGGRYETKTMADHAALSSGLAYRRIACIRIEFEEGQFDD